MLLSILFACTICFLVTVDSQYEGRQYRLVNIDQGPVRGFKSDEENLFSFYGIPYATVKERFQVAQPPPSWTKPFDAFDRGIVCPQYEMTSVDWSTKTVQNDCLVINVFVPDTNQTNLPVLVYVHGGVFHNGFGNFHRFTKFSISKHIIVVTFNYRIGVLGFLCLGTKKIPGNAGMKDQVAALRWLKRNINNFGGNSDEITLSGCSIGGAAVDLLMISKTTRGLFQRVICDSGSNLGAYSVQIDPIKNAKEQARTLNFTNVDNIEALQDFFIKVPIDDIIRKPINSRSDVLIINAPCVERDIGQEMFLNDTPYNILKSGDFIKYPIMYGLTDKEGSMNTEFIDEQEVMLNENFTNFLPGDLEFKNELETDKVAHFVKHFYFGNATINKHTFSSFIDFQSDILFVRPILRNINLQIEAGNREIYLYEYSYYDNDSSIPHLEGAGHCAQTHAVKDNNEKTNNEKYLNIKALLRNLWDNFIRTSNPVILGSPVPLWPPVDSNRTQHLSVNSTIELRGPLSEERVRFWNAIYERYYKQPRPPIW